MNARERAEGVMETWRRSWDLGPRLTEEVFLGWIEQAIIAAEEEARKEERKAFLQIVEAEEEYGERNKINEYACAARAIKGKIKARSEGEKKGE